MGLFDTQPGKAVWALGAVFANLAKFPLWIVYYTPRFNRPDPRWSLRQALQVQVIKVALWHMAFIKIITPLSLKPQKEKDRWVVMNPASKQHYIGPASIDPEITPTKCGGTWYPSLPTTTPTGTVILHFHGGAFMIGDGRTHDAGFAAKTLLSNTPATHVFAPQYRLSCNPQSRFPAALQDAITSYTYLVSDLNIPPSQIVLSGDSAGGNLVLSLLRYLTDHASKLTALPNQDVAMALLWSPWVSPHRSLGFEAFDGSPNRDTDYVSAMFAKWGADAYLPATSTGLSLQNEYCCFYDNVFATTVPIYISTGELEVLYHDDVKLAEDLERVPGNVVKLEVEPHAVHDTILAGKLLGFEKEARAAAKKAGDYLRSVQAKSKL